MQVESVVISTCSGKSEKAALRALGYLWQRKQLPFKCQQISGRKCGWTSSHDNRYQSHVPSCIKPLHRAGTMTDLNMSSCNVLCGSKQEEPPLVWTTLKDGNTLQGRQQNKQELKSEMTSNSRMRHRTKRRETKIETEADFELVSKWTPWLASTSSWGWSKFLNYRRWHALPKTSVI